MQQAAGRRQLSALNNGRPIPSSKTRWNGDRFADSAFSYYPKLGGRVTLFRRRGVGWWSTLHAVMRIHRLL